MNTLIREISLDTETTGLDPAEGHRIVEIGCVELIGGIRTGRHFHAYLHPERAMPREAEAVHGLSEAFLADKPLFAHIVEKFLEFIGDSPLVIHNAAFDLRFLNAELARAGKDVLAFSRAIDTVGMARLRHPGQPASLDALCRRYEIDATARTKHGALLDAELLAEVYLELCGGRQSALGLDAPAEEIVLLEVSSDNPVWPRRHFTVSAAEREAHRAFLSQVKGALWLTMENETA